jgi:iron(II)-dependent oxidoreductase
MSPRWAKPGRCPVLAAAQSAAVGTGHVGWFQDYWIARTGSVSAASPATPTTSRPAGRLPHADALYNSSRVAHVTRWALPLPDLVRRATTWPPAWTKRWRCWPTPTESDDALYFYRLALFHEDMHAEAGIYMAQALDIRAARRPLLAPAAARPKRARCSFRRSPGRSAGRPRICLRQRTGAA